jgi:hypothetical protein
MRRYVMAYIHMQHGEREPRFGQRVCSKISSAEDKLQIMSADCRIHV